jgi:hypothetical protein
MKDCAPQNSFQKTRMGGYSLDSIGSELGSMMDISENPNELAGSVTVWKFLKTRVTQILKEYPQL